MNTEDRVKALEDELKVLKNELKAVLLDMREQYLNIQDPFNFSGVSIPIGAQSVASGELKDKQEEPEVTGSGDDSGSIIAETGSSAVLTPTSDISGGAKGKKTDMPYQRVEESEHQNIKLVDVGVSRRLGANHKSSTDSELGIWQDDEFEEEEQEEQQPRPAVSRSRRKANRGLADGGSKAGIVVIAGLTHWLDQATAKLGKERTEALVEMSSAMGRLSPELKDALVRMARLSHHEANGQLANASDYLSLLAQLDNLIGGAKLQENGLLSILSMMKENHSG